MADHEALGIMGKMREKDEVDNERINKKNLPVVKTFESTDT